MRTTRTKIEAANELREKMEAGSSFHLYAAFHVQSGGKTQTPNKNKGCDLNNLVVAEQPSCNCERHRRCHPVGRADNVRD
jgi:hypothetical protein